MGFAGRFLGVDNIRREMRERTDQVRGDIKDLDRSMKANTRLLRNLAARGMSDDLKREFKDNLSQIAKDEEKLATTLMAHLEAMKRISGVL